MDASAGYGRGRRLLQLWGLRRRPTRHCRRRQHRHIRQIYPESGQTHDRRKRHAARAHLKDFDAELRASRARRCCEMGGIVEYQIRYAVEALRTGDRRARQPGASHDERTGQPARARRSTRPARRSIARRAPAANDLRFIMMVLQDDHRSRAHRRRGEEDRAGRPRGCGSHERLDPGHSADPASSPDW